MATPWSLTGTKKVIRQIHAKPEGISKRGSLAKILQSNECRGAAASLLMGCAGAGHVCLHDQQIPFSIQHLPLEKSMLYHSPIYISKRKTSLSKNMH